MEKWLQFTEFEEYVTWVTGGSGTKGFHFKAFRALFLGLGNFFHSFFPDWPENKKQPAVDTILGKLSYRGILLDPTYLYAKVETFVRQGDVLAAGGGLPVLDSAPTHWVVVSQTCTVMNDNTSLIAPCYLKASFAKNLRSIKPDKADDTSYAGFVAGNHMVRFLAFPPKDALWDEPLIVDLGVMVNVPSKTLRERKPIISLTYPGVAYFSNRLAVALFRDVRDCDDRRLIK